jgi:hypothetical protein
MYTSTEYAKENVARVVRYSRSLELVYFNEMRDVFISFHKNQYN